MIKKITQTEVIIRIPTQRLRTRVNTIRLNDLRIHNCRYSVLEKPYVNLMCIVEFHEMNVISIKKAMTKG